MVLHGRRRRLDGVGSRCSDAAAAAHEDEDEHGGDDHGHEGALEHRAVAVEGDVRRVGCLHARIAAEHPHAALVEKGRERVCVVPLRVCASVRLTTKNQPR